MLQLHSLSSWVIIILTFERFQTNLNDNLRWKTQFLADKIYELVQFLSL